MIGVIALSLGTKLKGHALRWPNPWGIEGGWLHVDHKAVIHVVCMYSIFAIYSKSVRYRLQPAHHCMDYHIYRHRTVKCLSY